MVNLGLGLGCNTGCLLWYFWRTLLSTCRWGHSLRAASLCLPFLPVLLVQLRWALGCSPLLGQRSLQQAGHTSSQNLSLSLVLGAWEKGQTPQGNKCREKAGSGGGKGKQAWRVQIISLGEKKLVCEGQTRWGVALLHSKGRAGSIGHVRRCKKCSFLTHHVAGSFRNYIYVLSSG